MDLKELMKQHFGARDTGCNVAIWEMYDFAHAFTNATHGLLAHSIFCPELVEIEGSVLLRQVLEYDDAAARFRSACEEKGRAYAEHAFNWLEVDYLFNEDEDAETMNETLWLAIAEAWRAWLRYKYPDREFVVTTADREETLDSLEVRFYEARCEADHENAKLEVVRG